MKRYLIHNNLIEKVEVLNLLSDANKYKYEDGWREEIKPQIDWITQYLGNVYFDIATDKVTYVVRNKTNEQIQAEKEAQLNAIDEAPIDNIVIKRLLQKITEPILADEPNLTQQDIEDAKLLYKQYRVGAIYDKDSNNNDEKRFIWNGELYKVIGVKHTSQADWTPDTAVSLYVKITHPGVIAEWKQPAGAHDVYAMGEKVTWKGKTWENTVDNNSWEPGVYGWVEV